mgnify:CR=1 FL=1|jgi:hypothetical protein
MDKETSRSVTPATESIKNSVHGVWHRAPSEETQGVVNPTGPGGLSTGANGAGKVLMAPSFTTAC